MFYTKRIAASLLVALLATPAAYAAAAPEHQANMPEIVVIAKKIDTEFGVNAHQMRALVLGNLSIRLAEHNDANARSATTQLIASSSLN